MEIRFSPEQEALLSQIASASGTVAEQLVKQTVSRMLHDRVRFIAGVRRGIEQADRGELVDDDEVRLWLEEQERS